MALVRLDRVAEATDFVANGSFAALKENVEYSYVREHALLVRTVDYNGGWNGKYVWVNEDSYKFLRKSSLKPGDVVLSNVGSIGVVFRVPDLGQPMTLGPNALMCRTKDNDVLDQRYLYYYFTSPIGQHAIQSIATGSVQAKFNKTDFRSLELDLPDIKHQRAIASILGALDDKIELNRRMNGTLEALAQAVFKEWFVEKAEEGWEEIPLGEIADLNWGDTNATKKLYTTSGFTAYSAAGPDGFLPYHDFDRTGVVVSAIGSAGKTYLAHGKWSCIKNTIRFWSTHPEVSTEYLYQATRGVEKWPLRGSVQPFISQTDARNIRVLLPSNGLAAKYGVVVRPFYEKIEANKAESRTLTALRDTLLPKLMRGEVRVKVKQYT